MVYKYDFLIIGSGIAGMSYALKVARAHKGKICMICKSSLLTPSHLWLDEVSSLIIS